MPAPAKPDANKYIVRFPDGMRDRIKEAAEKSGRSMNAEIIHRLEQSLHYSDDPMGDKGEFAAITRSIGQVQSNIEKLISIVSDGTKKTSK